MSLKKRIERIETSTGPKPAPIWFGPRDGIGHSAGEDLTLEQWQEKYADRLAANPGATACIIMETNNRRMTNDRTV